MGNQILAASVLMAIAGGMVASQAPINAALGRGIASPIGAATLSFGVGFVILVVATLLMGDGPNLLRVTKVPVWMLIGGALGAVYVVAALWSVPKLGVLTTTTLMIFGQMGAALLLDHLGAFGVAQSSISPMRILSAGLVAVGVILSRW
ncbi:EamA-like transporter family protein [Pelagivirga sediminicola]|uniref:EamA-like transporter family protein n=1 Tax=Pelagivirga sediminicola TaxID=2170575 RepID=A0A2T7GBB9_9RHOB|nr:DMT family transporter [Pelagivirga sediminicola]PVA11711.1 EamA-like transporter family protein [Pelagivirga sediminicola]